LNDKQESISFSSTWEQVNNDVVTASLLLVEREGDSYEETFWGQPKWPLFLTQATEKDEIAEFERLVDHPGEKLTGSFSIIKDAVWKVQNSPRTED
jgi:hypothetical protein